MYFTLLILKKGALLREHVKKYSSSTHTHQQIRTGKEHIQPIQVFCNSSTNYFSVSEQVFHDMEGVFNLAANRWLAPLDGSIPVFSNTLF